jgi:DnaJ-domain-containing protein 1
MLPWGVRSVRFLLLLFALLFAGYSDAATISVESSGPNKPALVIVTGTLNIDDTNQFSAKVGRLSNAIVRLQIEGGDLVTGIQIGEIIRLQSYATVVPEGWRCASACALAWFGGNDRFMEARAQIGFPSGYNVELARAVADYLSRMLLPPSAVKYIMYMWRAAPDATWLTVSDAKAVGIDVTPVGIDVAQNSVDPSAAPGTSIKIDEAAKTEEDVQAQIEKISSAFRQRQLEAIDKPTIKQVQSENSQQVQSENSQTPRKKDREFPLGILVVVFLGFIFLKQWKKNRAVKAQREAAGAQKKAQREQAEAQKKAQREQAEAQKEAQREQARQDNERRKQQRWREQAAETSKDHTRHWWDVLGVSPSASMDEIKRAYRSKLRMYHPDRVNGLGPELIRMAEDRTRELNSAFEQAKRATV